MMLRLGLLLIFRALAFAAGPVVAPPYTDTNSEQALRNMRLICSRDPSALSEAEGVEWVRARFAWVALLRLQNKDKEAVEVFAGCTKVCEKWGPSSEWAALKKWGCARKRMPFCS
ncbi:MAG: hypothetical protein ACXVB9_10480 [Bdellovibrionota bacterium]